MQKTSNMETHKILTIDAANKISAAVDAAIKTNKYKGYYTSLAGVTIESDPKDGHVTFLLIEGNLTYAPKRQIFFYRADDPGTFYIEGDVRADSDNQYAYQAAKNAFDAI